MEMIICKIPFLNCYTGIEGIDTKEILTKNYIEKNSIMPESYNFQDYNGHCYGYVSLRDGKVDLKSIQYRNSNEILFENCTVIFVSYNESLKNDVIIGWYNNAKGYKYLQRQLSYPAVGRDLYYNFKGISKGCHLLSLQDRNFIVKDIFKDGININIIEKNSIIYRDIKKYMNNTFEFINIVYTDEVLQKTVEGLPENINTIVRKGNYLLTQGNYYEALTYFNTAHKIQKSEITYFNIGIALKYLNCFKKSIDYFSELMDIEGETIELLGFVVYQYLIIGEDDLALKICDKLIYLLEENSNLIYEIYSIKIDILIRNNEILKSKELLQFIIKNTKDDEFKQYCKKVYEDI